MEEPTNEQTNPVEVPEGESIPENVPENVEQGETNEAKDEPIAPASEPPGPTKISPEMQQELKRLLRNTNRGRGLMIRLDALARPDLYKNSVNVNWVKDIQALDISVRPYDLAPNLIEQFRSYAWNNAMAYRFDDTSGQLVLCVRWFLPDALPVMDPNMNAFAMMAPAPKEPGPKLPEGVVPGKPDLKEVK